MQLVLASEQLGELIPSFIRTDANSNLTAIGPAIAQLLPKTAIGTPLGQHFRFLGGTDTNDLAIIARSNQHVDLQSTSANLRLRGPVLKVEDGFFLATHRLLTLDKLNENGTTITDFAPDDITVAARIMVGLQQQMLEEAGVVAAELQSERTITSTLIELNRLFVGRVAHEFNNCLTIIRLKCDKLGRKLIKRVEFAGAA